MDRLERRIGRYYAIAIAVALIAVTLLLALLLYAKEIRQVDTTAGDVLRVYAARVQFIGPITTTRQVAQLIEGTSYPGWTLTIAGDRTRYVVRWPSRQIMSEPRTAQPTAPFPWNVLSGVGLVAGAQAPKVIVNGTELALSPFSTLGSIAAQVFGAALIIIIVDVIVAISAGRILARRAIAPLRSLHEALSQMAETGAPASHSVVHGLNDPGGLITTYNRATEALKTAHAERDAAEARTHQFIADAGHQLRTPLTVINGFVGILLSGRLRNADDAPKILQKMSMQIAVMRKLVERLMVLEGWQSVEAPADELTDIGEFVTCVVDPIAASNPQMQVRINAAPGIMARVDRSELNYAVSNLVSNAIKYAPDGHIDVDVTADAQTVSISVADEGDGIPADHLPHIFERFYRGNRRDVPGSGLGLAIAKLAVERAGGTLSAKNRAEKGALFTIALPRAGALADRPTERRIDETAAAKR